MPRHDPELPGSDRRYRDLFEASPLPTWAFDRKTLRFLEVNQAAIDHYGYSREAFLAMTIEDIRPAEDVDRLREHIAAVESLSTIDTWRHRTRDGRIIFVSLRGSDFRFEGREARLVVAHDMTVQMEAEERARRLDLELRHTRKMEAIGRLASGIAHDFNNILTVVVANSSLLAERLTGDEALRQYAQEIETAGLHGSELTQQLLELGRPRVVEPALIDLDTVIAEVQSLLRRLLGPRIHFTVQSDGGNHRVYGNRSQLEQVVLNLVVNARDAMPSGGKLQIELRRREVEGGPVVALSVVDTGCGMDENTRLRIFEPFFTTKQPGNGTGLGLATVYAIVSQVGGRVAVRSQPSHGSTFEVILAAATPG